MPISIYIIRRLEHQHELTTLRDLNLRLQFVCVPFSFQGVEFYSNEETKIIVPADATRYGNLIVAPFIAAPVLVIAFIVYLVMTSKWFRNRKKADSKPHK